MPKEISPQEKELVREFKDLRDQKYELNLVADKLNEEGRQVRLSFLAKSPGANFVGSPEWEQHLKKERQWAHEFAELEDKLKTVEGKLDALVSPEERKLENQISNLEDRISDMEDKISELEDAGKPTNIVEQQKANLEKQLDSLLAQSQGLTSKTSPKAEAKGDFAKKLALTKPKAEHPHWEPVNGKWVEFPN